MTDMEIKAKFQLLSNQRNQQKREVCPEIVFRQEKEELFLVFHIFMKVVLNGMKIFLKREKRQKKGCIGCPWYDIETWRKKVINKLQEEE
ncbi:MAG: hypothetical protein ACLSEY_08155 [Enterocloster sp.]